MQELRIEHIEARTGRQWTNSLFFSKTWHDLAVKGQVSEPRPVCQPSHGVGWVDFRRWNMYREWYFIPDESNMYVKELFSPYSHLEFFLQELFSPYSHLDFFYRSCFPPIAT